MQKLYYFGKNEKSAINGNSDLPQDAYNVLEVSFSELGIDGRILPYIEWTSEGITTDLEQAKSELKYNNNSSNIKQLERLAFTQQNKIIDQNMSQFLWDMFKGFDLSVCLIAKNYKDFLDALWLQYHTDKANLNFDVDYSTIVPANEYSYQEIEAEYVANK